MGSGPTERPDTPVKKEAMIAAMAKYGIVRASCEEVGVARSTHQFWLEHDAAYATAIKEAKTEAIELMETEVRRRAVEGTDKPVFQNGKECGKVREYSDTLLMFALKAANPEKYRDNHQHNVNVHGTLDHQHQHTLTLAQVEQIPIAERRRLAVVLAQMQQLPAPDDVEDGGGDGEAG